jgi:hypothetical protein
VKNQAHQSLGTGLDGLLVVGGMNDIALGAFDDGQDSACSLVGKPYAWPWCTKRFLLISAFTRR